MRSRYALLFVFALFAHRADGQRGPQLDPRAKTIFSTDSLIQQPALSADKRWLAFSQKGVGYSTAIWVVALPNGKPFPVTSDGYFDETPQFTAAGDRLLFQSNRPSRNDIDSRYLMSVPLDPATKRPTGPVRQIGIESLLLQYEASPDGQRVAYTVHPQNDTATTQLKVMPINGGNAIVLATAPNILAAAIWSTDSKWIFFQDRRDAEKHGILKKVAVGGGDVMTVRDPSDGFIWAMPGSPDHFVRLHAMPNGMTTFESYNPAGEKVSTIAFPTNSSWARFDFGPSLMGVQMNARISARGLSLESGAVEPLYRGDGNSEPFAFTPDGAVLQLKSDSGAAQLLKIRVDKVVSTMPLSSAVERADALLPGEKWFAATRRSPTSGTSGTSGTSAFVAEVSSGHVRQVSSSFLRWYHLGPSTVGFAELKGDTVVLNRLDASGASWPVRTFTRADYRRIADISMLGSRIVYAMWNKTQDSAVVYYADSVAPSRVVETIQANAASGFRMELAPSGHSVGAMFQTGSKKSSRLAVIRFSSGSAPGALTYADLGATADVGSYYWTADERELVVAGLTAQGKIELFRTGVGGRQPPTPILVRAQGDLVDFMPSIDRRSIILMEFASAGCTVWTAPLLPTPR